MADLAGWPYWKVISITGQSGAGTDYQVELEIGDSAGGDFHLEGHCTNFPQDIRITDDDGTTLLDHFVEDITADPIVVHIEVKDDLGSNQDIRVYYGKSGETTASDIETTFLFGDDFPGSSIDTAKWEYDTGNASVVNSVMTYTQATASWAKIDGKVDFGVGYTIISKAYFINDYCSIGWRSNRGTPYTDMFIRPSNVEEARTQNVGATTNTSELSRDGYHIFKIKRDTNYAGFFDDGLEVTGSPITTNVPTDNLPVEIGAYEGQIKLYWVAISKYNSPEPAFSSAGAEQTPTGVSPTSVFYGPLVGPFGGPI